MFVHDLQWFIEHTFRTAPAKVFFFSLVPFPGSAECMATANPCKRYNCGDLCDAVHQLLRSAPDGSFMCQRELRGGAVLALHSRS